ncbi:hypothetical protein [Agrobacterium tumefaciens]|uniref:hypothetical protein n=1 Tax=Agrobacterium tumefaciens TaxID=358 RepID=UPI000714DA7C|nr:hypothetical protein ASD74_21125 [Rhizobium sp. Root564]NTC84140.1 hypothetical protein [Agrobacterium tumefaciens]NTD11665.1 hypothetical protein [Agrobacterium tumefaciens]
MDDTPKPGLDLSATLRKVRDTVIHVECLRCRRTGAFIRTEIVKKHGANITLARLRRMAAMGCDRIASGDGDRCETRFLYPGPTGTERPDK